MKLVTYGPNCHGLVFTSNGIGKEIVEILFSYSIPVAAYVCPLEGERFHYRTNEKYSVTTSKHINTWLNGEIAQEVPPSFFEGKIKVTYK